METSIDLDISDYPTLLKFAESNAMFTAVRGPAGSAKTTNIIKLIIHRGISQSPGIDGVRRTKWAIARNTYAVLEANIIPSIKFIARDLVHVSGSKPPKGKIQFPLPDKTSVDIELIFRACDKEEQLRDLLGGDYTAAFLDELSELKEFVAIGMIGRVGRYPSGHLGTCDWSGVYGATNGPKEDHWLYDWEYPNDKKKLDFLEYERDANRKYFEIFSQPPALIRPKNENGRWEENPLAENIKNIKDGYAYYYAKIASGDEEHIKAYVEGEYAILPTGSPIFTEFNKRHIFKKDSFKIDPFDKIYIGMDTGRTPTALIATTMRYGGIRVLNEILGEDMSADRFCSDLLLPFLRSNYPQNQVEILWADPSGSHGSQNIEKSVYDVIMDHGLNVQIPGSNKLQPRLEAVSKYLRLNDGKGYPKIMVSDQCEYLIDSLSRTYVWIPIGQFDRVPTKSHKKNCSDLADALQYLCMGYDNLSIANPRKVSYHKKNGFGIPN